MSDELELYRKAYERERAARQAAEQVVERKTRELFRKNQDLEASLEQLKQQQRVLVQTEKLATLGTLAAGVAHEINNPMAFVYANLETLGTYTPVFEKLYALLVEVSNDPELVNTELSQRITELIEAEDLDFIFEDLPEMITDTRDGIERVRDIVLNLRSFARTKSNERTPADLVQGLRSTIKLLNNQLKTTTHVELDLNPVPEIECNLNELNQVFLNLLVNAVHAVASREEGHIRLHTAVEQDRILIEIADNGMGIPEERIDRVFEPFYTTKPTGEGTGMGLAIAYGIIKDHGGEISVESVWNQGTCFKISLPI